MAWFSRFFNADQGAPRRAFFSPHLRVALLLSLVLHSLLIALTWQRARPMVKPRHGGELEVRLEFFVPAPPATIVTRVVERLALTEESPRVREAVSTTMPPSEPPTSVGPATETAAKVVTLPPPVPGLAIAQPLPGAFPGKRSLWSYSSPVAANIEATYQAQRQHQARLEMQARAQTAVAQYDARLRQVLSGLSLQADCLIHFTTGEALRWQCRQAADAEALRAELSTLGDPPGLMVGKGRWLISLAPDLAGGSLRIERRGADEDSVTGH